MSDRSLSAEDFDNHRVRERLESDQRRVLSEHACHPEDSEGRLEHEEPDSIRTAFQLDRDRVLHSREFRRLRFKTQVFIEPVNDDTRTRLTHTLEVMQISRTVARALGLNEDLVEAIALAHDIGHTPFAHSGESVLDELSENGFHHSNQSLRVVDRLANGGEGLNLTREVRDGIVKHSKSEQSMFESVAGTEPVTLEGSIVRMCDSIAYINHDIDDAMQAGVLDAEDLPTEARDRLGEHGGERINESVRDIILSSYGEGELKMSPEIQEANDELRSYMFENVYHVLGDRSMAREARRVVRELYEYFHDHPDLVYNYRPFLENAETADPVIDFLSLQSDKTTIDLYRDHIGDPLEHLPRYSF
jgi:dGTPase